MSAHHSTMLHIAPVYHGVIGLWRTTVRVSQTVHTYKPSDSVSPRCNACALGGLVIQKLHVSLRITSPCHTTLSDTVGASTGVTRLLVRVVPCCHRRECSAVHRSIPHHAWPSCDERGVLSVPRGSHTACTRKAASVIDDTVDCCSRGRSSTD